MKFTSAFPMVKMTMLMSRMEMFNCAEWKAR